MALTAGELRFRVTHLRRVSTPNSLTNEMTATYKELGRHWASIEPMTSNEILRSKQAQLDSTHRIKMRWFKDLKSSDQLTYIGPDKTHTYNITGVRDIENMHYEYELTATETTSG